MSVLYLPKKIAEMKANIEEASESETITYTGYTSKNASNQILMPTEVDNDGVKFIQVTNTDHTRYTFKTETNFNSEANFSGTSESNFTLSLFNSSGTVLRESRQETGASGIGSVSLSGKANEGDYLTIDNVSSGNNDNKNNFSVTATPIKLELDWT